MSGERLAEPPEAAGGNPIQGIEISFAVPVYATDVDYQLLDLILDRLVGKPFNQLKDGPHWVAGCGSKPKWSQADSIFLGKPVHADAPVSGEPEFDDSVYFVETSARAYLDDDERQKSLADKAKYRTGRARHQIDILRSAIAEIEAELEGGAA